MSDKSKIERKIVLAKDKERRAKKSGALNLQRGKLKRCFATTRATRHAIWFILDWLGFVSESLTRYIKSFARCRITNICDWFSRILLQCILANLE